MDLYPYAWGAIVGIGVALEAYTLWRNRQGDTLSEQVWGILDWADKHHPRLATVGRIFLVGGGVWLGLHFAFKL